MNRTRRAIRYNMLVNPKGKPACFRAVDWVQEFNNLLTKVWPILLPERSMHKFADFSM